MTSFLDLFNLVYKNMVEKKKRVFLTISGIIVGIFTFTFFLFASQGLTNAITEQFSSFGINVLIIQPISNDNRGPPGSGDLTDTDLEKVKQVINNYNYITPDIFMSDKLYEYSRVKETIVSLAYPDEYYPLVRDELEIEMEEGRNLRPGDSGVAIVGAKTALNQFGNDNPIKVGSVLEVEGQKLRVVGIIKERGDLFVDNSLLMSFDDIKEISGRDTYSSFRISYQEGVNLEDEKEAILRKLNPNGEEKRVEVSSPQDSIEQFNSIIGVLTLIISFISFIALIVGGINVMNTMYSNILERINEISVIKALGGKNSDIRNLFLIESSILGFLGAFLGFFMAYGLAELLSYIITNVLSYNVPIYFRIDFFLEIVIGTSIFATIFGTYPAIKASKVNPADNLRDE
jgi:putative ABC transport system permease protein